MADNFGELKSTLKESERKNTKTAVVEETARIRREQIMEDNRRADKAEFEENNKNESWYNNVRSKQKRG